MRQPISALPIAPGQPALEQLDHAGADENEAKAEGGDGEDERLAVARIGEGAAEESGQSHHEDVRDAVMQLFREAEADFVSASSGQSAARGVVRERPPSAASAMATAVELAPALR